MLILLRAGGPADLDQADTEQAVKESQQCGPVVGRTVHVSDGGARRNLFLGRQNRILRDLEEKNVGRGAGGCEAALVLMQFGTSGQHQQGNSQNSRGNFHTYLLIEFAML